jgi:hypothetical protein
VGTAAGLLFLLIGQRFQAQIAMLESPFVMSTAPMKRMGESSLGTMPTNQAGV